MNRKQALSTALIILMLALTLISANSTQSNDVRPISFPTVWDSRHLVRPILFASIVAGSGSHEDTNLLNQSTRMEIYDFVKNNPGAHFRFICSSLGLPIGVAQYHIERLTEADLISSRRYRHFKRYFERGRFDETEMKVISSLRHETVRIILTILLERHLISHKDLASVVEVSSQALTWQMKRLKEDGLVRSVTDNGRVKYLLDENHAPAIKRCTTLLN